jgi:hypothetical protein
MSMVRDKKNGLQTRHAWYKKACNTFFSPEEGTPLHSEISFTVTKGTGHDI